MDYKEKAEAMTTILGGRTFSSEAEAHRCSVGMMEAALRQSAAQVLIEDADWHDMAYREYRGKDGARAHIHMISADHARAKAAAIDKSEWGMSEERINATLVSLGYDPEQVVPRGRVLISALIANGELRTALTASQERERVMREALQKLVDESDWRYKFQDPGPFTESELKRAVQSAQKILAALAPKGESR